MDWTGSMLVAVRILSNVSAVTLLDFNPFPPIPCEKHLIVAIEMSRSP